MEIKKKITTKYICECIKNMILTGPLYPGPHAFSQIYFETFNTCSVINMSWDVEIKLEYNCMIRPLLKMIHDDAFAYLTRINFCCDFSFLYCN